MTEHDLNEFIVAALESESWDKGPINQWFVRNAMSLTLEAYDADDDAIGAFIDEAIQQVDHLLDVEKRENPNDEYDPCSKHD